MTQTQMIQTILRDSAYHPGLFSHDEITALGERVLTKVVRNRETPFVRCIVRDKDIQLKPEEIVHYEEFTTETAAIKREKELKTGFGRKWLKREYEKDRLTGWNEVLAARQAGGNGQYKLDNNGHLIVDHDLHNHDGALPDGIAEAFIEWARSEDLSFWN